MIERRYIKALEPIAAKIGLRFKELGRDECMYVPGKVNLAHCGELADLAHEIAHYVAALPDERQRRNFGWHQTPDGPSARENAIVPPGGWGTWKDRPRATMFGPRRLYHLRYPGYCPRSRLGGFTRAFTSRPPTLCVKEEQVASILGIMIERALWTDWKATVDDHNWDWPEFWLVSRTMVRWGLLDTDFTPRCMYGDLLW
jgi:hypothetical protein